MKHLKKFNTTTEYDQFKSGSEFVLPNVSFVVENTGVKFNPNAKPASPNIVVTYNVPEDYPYDSIQICGNYAGNNITSMILDGVEMDLDYYFDNFSSGKYVVEFILNDKTTMPRGMFIDNAMVSVMEKIELPATLTNYTFYINCKDSTVKEIIFNSETAPSSVDWNGVVYDTHVDCVIKYPKGSDYSSVISNLPNRYTAVEF